MPIYEYQCLKCNHQLEALQKISDEALTDCPACGQSELVKLVSAAGFQLKGTGWYVTDYSKKGKAKAADVDSGDSQAGGSSDTHSNNTTTSQSDNSTKQTSGE